MNKTTKSAILIFWLLCLIYLLTAKGFIEISDTYFSILTAKSLVEKGSFSIDEYRGGYTLRSPDGNCYSKYGIGLALIFVPYIIAAKFITHLGAFPEEFVTNFLVSFYNIFFGAGTAVVFFYMLRRFFSASLKTSTITALALGLATIQWRYSIWTFSEAAGGFFLITSIYLVLKNTRCSLLTASLSYAFLILTSAANLVYIPLFLIYIWARNKETSGNAIGRVSLFLSFVLTAVCLSLLLNYVRFHDILEFGYGPEMVMFYPQGIRINIPKLLYYLDKGVFIYNPVFILSVAGYFKFFKLYRRETIFFISIIAFNLITTSMWHMWYGGWCWGPRFLVPVAPLWVLPLYLFISKRGAGAGYTAIVFISVSLAVQILSVLAGNLEYHLICDANNKEGLRRGMPANIIGSAVLLKHKLLKNDNIYKLSEFGIDSDTIVNTSGSECYKGLDFWYCYLGRIKK